MITGSIQEKNGFYYAVINLKDEKGDRVVKWIGTGFKSVKGNKRAAEGFLQNEIAKWNLRNGIYVGTGFADYLETWIVQIKDSVRPNTYRNYCGNIKNHVIPYFRAHPIALQDITPFVLEDYYRFLLNPDNNLENGAALSPATIRHHHQNISKALTDACRRGLINANPASTAKLPKGQSFKPTFLNREQLRELEVLFVGNVCELPVQLAMIYGFRRSEVLGLKWKSVDFYKRTITICETLQQGENGDYSDAPKTESSYRTMPMTNRAYALLKEKQTAQIESKKVMGAYYIKSDYVCTWPNGEVITPNFLTRTFHTVVSQSNLPTIRFHDLRHSVASNLLNEGFSVVQVQEWLGHSSAATTLNFYAHVDKTSKLSIAYALDEDDPKYKTEPEEKKTKAVAVKKVNKINTVQKHIGQQKKWHK